MHHNFENKISICTEHHWTEVTKHAKGALVLMDDAAAECLHWHGGFARMLRDGAEAVESFSPFVSADPKIKKVVFVLTSTLTGETWKTISIIIHANNFNNCMVLPALPSKCHCDETESSNLVFSMLERQLYNWVQNKNFSATVYHIPLLSAYVSQNVFIMPAFTKFYSVYKCGLAEMNTRRTDDNSSKNLQPSMMTAIKNLALSVGSLLDTIQVKGDFFSLGPLSHAVCSELESISQLQKKNYSNKASMVVIDRLMDLAGPLSQTYETMLDKILLALPHLPGHTFDVAVPMSELGSCKGGSVFGQPLLAPGCLSHKSSPLEESTLNAILTKKPREALIDVNRNLVDLAVKEGINLDLSSRLIPDILRQHVQHFKEKPPSLSHGLLQQALAVVQAMDYSSTNSVDNLPAIEKALLEYLATSPEEVLNNIMQMISEKEEMNYKMEEIIIFLAFFYMLSSDSSAENETAMQATLMEEFFQDKNVNELRDLFVDGEQGDDHILNTVRTFFAVLKKLSSMRKRLKKYQTLFKSTNPAFPASYNSLLNQLLQDLFDTRISDIPDIEFHSAGLKDYIKTGFSLFMNVAKPQPRDNPVIFIIILGGITASEVRLIQETALKAKKTEIFVGCTGLLTPKDVLKDLGLIVKQLTNENFEENMF